MQLKLEPIAEASLCDAEREDSPVESLLLRLHGVIDAASFWSVLQSILQELTPAEAAVAGDGPRDFDARQIALLKRLHPHIQSVLCRLSAQDPQSADGRAAGLSASVGGNFWLRESVGRLTRAERELVELLCEGFSNREIAERRDKSVRTVKTQLTSVYKKLGVKSRSKLLAMMR